MTDVFVSYQRRDEARVARMVRKLESAGLEVWWDRHLSSGGQWREEIESELHNAKVVVVVWSHASAGADGQFVRDEASRAGHRLLSVLLDRVRPPLGFGETQSIDLSRWHGSLADPALEDLVNAIKAKFDGKPAPKPRAPSLRAARRLLLGGGFATALIAVASFAWTAPGVRVGICSIPVGQPALRIACCSSGFTPPILVRSDKDTQTTVQRVGYLRQGAAPRPLEADAKLEASGRLQADAELLCTPASPSERLLSAGANIVAFRCSSNDDGFRCAADYLAQCHFAARELVEKCQ